MSQALSVFLNSARNVGIVDLSQSFAAAAGQLLHDLKEFGFPNAVSRMVYHQTVVRLRQADPENFIRVPNIANASGFISSNQAPSLNFQPIDDVESAVKELLRTALGHTVAIARTMGRGDETEGYKKALQCLAKAHAIPDDIVQSHIDFMSGVETNLLANQKLTHPGEAFDGERGDRYTARFARSDTPEVNLGSGGFEAKRARIIDVSADKDDTNTRL